jgi:hypothetical protein
MKTGSAPGPQEYSNTSLQLVLLLWRQLSLLMQLLPHILQHLLLLLP